MKKLFLLLLCLPMIGFGQDNNEPISVQKKFFISALEINKNGNNYFFNIKNPKISDGVIKNHHRISLVRKENDFLCYILNENHKIIDSLEIGNPLEIRYEFDNEDGEIAFKVINVNKNEIIIRFQFLNQMKYLKILKIEKDGLLKQITTLTLPI